MPDSTTEEANPEGVSCSGSCAQALTAAADVARELEDEHGFDPAKVFRQVDVLLADLDRITYALLQEDCDLSQGDDEEYLRSIQQKLRQLKAEGEA